MSFTFLEIAVFLIAVTAFLLAVRFFIASQKNLQHLLPASRKKNSVLGLGIDKDGFIVPTRKERLSKAAQNMLENNEQTKKEIKELRDALQLQQIELTRALRQIDTLNEVKEQDEYDDVYEDDKYEDDLYSKKHQSQEKKYDTENNLLAEELKYQLERKEAELKELRQQTELNQNLQKHFEGVQAGYEELQLKVQKMEQQAWQGAEITIKIDSLEQLNEQLEKTVLKKEEKVRELSVENGRLHEMLNQSEDKLSEANFQRQQLQKKTMFLEEINNDMQQMSDANRKLKNEIRRVAELESMLNLITEERDALLKRKPSRV